MRSPLLFSVVFIVGIALLLIPNRISLPRGIRNNNPGNIRRTADQWEGMAEVQTDPEFVQFISPEYGFRAMVRILRSYERRGVVTIQDIITTYSPSSENNTTNYIRFVATELDRSPDTAIDLDRDALPLIRAMATFENGARFANYYDDQIIQQGIALA